MVPYRTLAIAVSDGRSRLSRAPVRQVPAVVSKTIDAALALNLNNAETIKSQLSSVQDVDLAEATMNLQTQQVAYQAALGALSKVLGPSLLDFIPRG